MRLRAIFRRILPARVRVYADFMDPFSYVGVHNLWRVLEETSIGFDWRGFEFNPETPAEGMTLESAANSDLRPGMWASVREFARQSNIECREPKRLPKTLRAHQLVDLATGSDVKKSLIEALFQAYFISEKDIGDANVLKTLAREQGLPMNQVELLFKLPESPKTSERHRQEALQHRFAGLPGFVFRGKTFFGALSRDAWKTILLPTPEETIAHA